MKEWFGSAAVCINEKNEVLMVKAYHSDLWAVPSGGMEKGETPEECCIREVMEETGYEAVILNKLFIKEMTIKGIHVKTYYFKMKKVGESIGTNDLDKIIEEVAWKSISDIQKIRHAYPEDIELLMKALRNNVEKAECECKKREN